MNPIIWSVVKDRVALNLIVMKLYLASKTIPKLLLLQAQMSDCKCCSVQLLATESA